MRPLYLSAPQVKAVMLDHVALKISSRDKADVWLPLARISRIVVFGTMQWDSNALIACMRQGIAVSFADPEGDFAGICMGETSYPHNLLADVLEYFSFEEGRYLLENWFCAQHRQLLLKIQRRYHLPKRLTDAQEIRVLLARQIALKYYDRHWQRNVARLVPMLASHIGVLLQHYGFNLTLLRPLPGHRGLLAELLSLMEWELWQLAANGHLPQGTQKKHLTHYYQQHQQVLEQRSLQWIGKLWNRMNELHHEQQH